MSKSMYALGIALIAGFAVLMVMEMQSAATPYVTKVANVRESAGRAIQFKGAIIHSKTSYDRAAQATRFTLRDDNGQTLDVSYDGAKPGNFDTADVAVVRGIYRGGSLKADRVSVNCPSKYQGQK
jgi:cytochrome c-type biogenesis protein CcmE